MNNLKSGWLGAMKSGLLAAISHANQFIYKWRTIIRAGYVGALCLAISAVLVGGIETVQGAPGGTPGKPGGGGSTKATSFSGVNLGALPGDSWSIAFAVSESGSVIGESSLESNSTETIHSPAYWYFNGQQWVVYALPKGSNESNGTAFGIAGPVDAKEYVVGSVGDAAVIWTVIGNTPFSDPAPLDQDKTCTWSVANSVNVWGDAVGMCDYRAAIWNSGPNGYSMKVLDNPASGYTEAMDVNDDGVVVGRDCELLPTESCHAFVMKIGSNTAVQLNDQINGDPYSYAAAVSDVVTINDTAVVYVTGSTTSAEGVETGTRWTVTISEQGSLLPAVAQVTLTKQWCSGVNNAGDAVCTSSGGGRQSAALVRDGAMNNLKPPKRATDAARFDLTRADRLPTYAVGVAQVDGLRATVWVIDK